MIMIIKYLYITWLLLCKSVQGNSGNSSLNLQVCSSNGTQCQKPSSAIQSTVNGNSKWETVNGNSKWETVNGNAISLNSNTSSFSHILSISESSSFISIFSFSTSLATTGTGFSSAILGSSTSEFTTCSGDKKIPCENGGSCFHNKLTSTDNCFCSNSFYGNKCQYKAESPIPHVYKQLAYGFGGTTVFLLLVIIVLTCCCSKSRLKKDSSYDYSKELEDFTIANKRASIVKPSVLNAYDVYAT